MRPEQALSKLDPQRSNLKLEELRSDQIKSNNKLIVIEDNSIIKVYTEIWMKNNQTQMSSHETKKA